MATLRSQILPLTDYPTGAIAVGPIALRAQDRQFYAELRRCTPASPTIWPHAFTTIKADLEVSVDGGVTWRYGGGMTAIGGIHASPAGVLSNTTLLVPLPNVGQTGRQIRGTIEIINGPLRSEGFAELRD